MRWLLAALTALLAAAQQPLSLGGGHTLVPRLTFTDQLGRTHTRLVHRYQGLRVWGSELVTHGPGTIPTPSMALPMLDDTTPLAEPIDLDLTPTVLLDAAQADIRPLFGGGAVTFESPELVIYPRFLDLPAGLPARGPGGTLDATMVHQHLAGYALAYLIRASADTGDPLNDVWDCLVDAHAGNLLQRIPVNQGAAPAQGGAATLALPETGGQPAPMIAGGTPVVGVGRSLYSGTVDLNTSATASGFTLLDTTRGILTAKNVQGALYGGNAVVDMGHSINGTPNIYSNSTNTWGNGTAPPSVGPTTTPTGQTIAVDAAYGLQSTWDFYQNVFGRSGIDGDGSMTYVRVNYGGNDGKFDNAFWSSGTFSLTIEDGQRNWPLANLTVMAHEFTHGVTNSSSGLIYAGESGGLNEASSDIFGVMTDTYTRLAPPPPPPPLAATIPANGTAWIIPETLATPPNKVIPLRSMIKPSLDFVSPNAWSPTLSTIDVHYSSGPMNRAFYYMSQGASAALAAPSYSNYLPAGMTGIGNDAAARIWYRALTVYLTPSSNYKQARTAALRAAQDLFPPDASGNASAQTIAVRKAFGAINVGDPYATVDDLTNPSVVPSLTPAAATPSGTPLTLSATVTGTYGVNEVDYFVDTILVAAAFNPPNFNVQLDAAHLLANTTANGPHYLTAAAYAPSGNAGVSSPPGVAFTTSNPVQQILVDPGFEGGGMTGWQGDTSLAVQTDYTGTIAHSGYRYARFDRSAGEQSLTLSQQVTIPAGTTSAVLSLWSQVQGNPALNAADTLQIQIQSGQGSAPVVLDTLTTQQIRGDWTRSSYDLSAYQGQVTLSLVSSVGVNTGTAFLVDDLALTCSAVPQVQVQVSLNPAVFGPQPLTVDTFSRAPIGPLYAQVTGGPGSTAVAWSVLEGATGGTLSPGPTPSYTPPWLYGFFHVVATSVADPTVSAQASMHWLNALTLLPAAATLETGASLPFQVVAASFINPVFSVTGGSVAQTGPGTVTYTAPAAPGTYTLTATSLNYQSSATLTVIAPLQVTITPASLTMVAGSSVPLSATVIGSGNTDVAWTIQEGAVGGIITNSGDDSPPVYTASGIIGTYHLVATCVADPTRSAVLTITVQAGGIAINPASATVITGGTVGFQAFATLNQPVTWSLPAGGTAGAIDSFGNYTAPAAPGSYLVQAATAGGLSSSATVQVLTTNFSGDGKPFMNSADLAILADAWGSTPGSANWNPAVDLNGDGVINDLDVTLFFTQFGGF